MFEELAYAVCIFVFISKLVFRSLPLIMYASRGDGGGSTLMHTNVYKGGEGGGAPKIHVLYT